MGAAIVTDLLDGRLARRLRQASDLGRNLDSTVDFVLIYSLFIAFYVGGRLETYQFGVLYVAMLLNLLVQMASLGLLEAGGLARTIAGKPTGALQYGYLLFLVAREVMPSTHTVVLIDRIFFGVLAVAIAANCIECAIRLRRFR
jgi:phosphatidylglycerophosphate synthase